MVPCLRVGVGGEYRAYQMRLVEKPAKSDTFAIAKQDYLEDILRMLLHFSTSGVCSQGVKILQRLKDINTIILY